MATYVLMHGAASDSWYWHLVAPRLRELGHEVIAPDMPVDDDDAGLAEYADAVVDAIGDRSGVIIVAQSMAGFTAPLVAERVPTDLIVLLAAMAPAPGESPGQWWGATEQAEAKRAYAIEQGLDPDAGFDPMVDFFHDVPKDVVEAAFERGEKNQADTPFMKPWPLAAWPSVPTRFLACTEDRFFPLAFQRRVVAERLGLDIDEFSSGHLAALAHPAELVERLEGYRTDAGL